MMKLCYATYTRILKLYPEAQLDLENRLQVQVSLFLCFFWKRKVSWMKIQKRCQRPSRYQRLLKRVLSKTKILQRVLKIDCPHADGRSDEGDLPSLVIEAARWLQTWWASNETRHIWSRFRALNVYAHWKILIISSVKPNYSNSVQREREREREREQIFSIECDS